MIKLYLKAKHWQLFILLFGIPLIIQFFLMFNMFLEVESDSSPKYMISILQIFPLLMILFTGLFFGWFWSIVFGLKEEIPKEIKMNTKKFKFFFFFPLVYIFFLMLYITGIFNGFNIGNWIIGIILPLHLFSMFSIFFTLYFVAKTIKTAELKKEVNFGEFAGEFFLLWFYFIGIWIIQPKINLLANNKNVTKSRH